MSEPSIQASLISVFFLWTCGALTLAGLRSNWKPSQDLLGSFLSLPVGVAVHQCWLLALLVGNLSTGTRVDIFVLIGLLTLAMVYGKEKPKSHLRFFTLNLVALSVSQLAIATFVRSRNLVNWHTDSYHHLAIGRALADGQYDHVDNMMKEWRGLSGSPSIALAAKWGGQYGVTLVPTLAFVTVLIVVFFFLKTAVPIYEAFKDQDHVRMFLKNAGVLKLLLFCNLVFVLYTLIKSDRFQFHAFYLNTHLQLSILFICLLILLPRLTGNKTDSPDSLLSGSHVYEILVLAIFLTRVEGQLLVAPLIVLIASTQLSTLKCLRYGGSPVILALVKQVGERGQAWSESLTSREVFFQVIVLVVALCLFKIFTTHSDLVPVIFDPKWLWIGVTIGVALNQTMRDAIPIIWQNLFLGEGSWGVSFYLLLTGSSVLAILGKTAYFPINNTQTDISGVADSLLAGSYFAVMIFTHLFRGSPGRLGHNDSFNRAALTGFVLVVFWIVRKTETVVNVNRHTKPKEESHA